MTEKGVFLVTGGSRGIGAATALRAARAGWPVAIFYRERAAEAKQVTDAIERAGGRGLAVRCDVGDEDALVAGFEAVDRFGRLEVLVNNAGITGGVKRLAEVDRATVEDVFRVNVTAVFLACREAVRRMSTKRGGQGGAIVNISSGASQSGSPGTWIHYAATKGAVDTLTVGLAREVAAEGIRVNAIRAGMISTEIHAARTPEMTAKMVAAIPLGRMGTPEELANVVVWLASGEAGYVTGAVMGVSGGG